MNNKRSWTNTAQMICAAALLLLFGISAYVLTVAVGNAYSRMTQQQETEFRLRVAANYMTMHMRRADTEGGISAQSSPFGDCLVLSEDIDGETYETRIYLSGGYLQESFVSADMPYDEYAGFDIIELDGFGVAAEDGTVYVTLSAGGDTRVVTVKPMSEGG